MDSQADYSVFDIDTHYYEPADCFTRHIDPKHRDLAVHWRDLPEGQKLFVGDRPYTFVKDPTFSFVEKPGNLAEMLRQGVHALEGGGDKVPPPPEFIDDRDRRLVVLDQQGIDACMIFPTLAVTIEHFMRHDPVQTFANVSSFNKWLEEDWGYAYKNRIHAVPLLSLLDLDMAVAELERVLAQGAKAIHLMPGPQGNRSPADPVFDPFWARVNEAGVPVALHISESGYNELFSTIWGEEANPTSHEQSAFQWTNFFGDRPIMDTISSMIYMNLFGKFPNIKVFSVENGSLWVNYLVKAMDKMKGMGRNGPWPGGYVKGRPSEVFKRHVFVSPYFEEDIDVLTDLIGADQVLFGSDYPHSEGLADPLEYKKDLSHFPVETQARIMGGNARQLLGIAA